MNLLLAIALCSGLDLYFVKDSPNLIVRIVPEVTANQITLLYSYKAADWDTMSLLVNDRFIDAVLAPPESLKVIGLYYLYDNGTRDDNKGKLYLYEIKRSPRFLMPFSVADLETMLASAKKKILSGTHADEGMVLVDYILEVAPLVPYLPGTEQETKITILQSEAAELKKQ